MPDDDEVDEEEERSGLRSFWSGTLTFGLVSIPVDLFSANRSAKPRMRMLTSEGVPLRRAYFDAKQDRELEAEDLVRGFAVEKDRFVMVTAEELESIEPELSRDIHLRRFVPRDQVPPAYFRRGYYLAPAGRSTRAYAMLAQTMEREERAGLATFAMRGKAYVVAIVAKHGILQAETLRFADELRSPDDVGLPARKEPEEKQVRAFEKAIRGLAADELDPELLRDERAEAIEQLAQKKLAAGTDIVEQPDAPEAEEHAEWGPTDLMALLKERLRGEESEARPKKKAKAASARSRPAKKAAKKSGTAHKAPARRSKTGTAAKSGAKARSAKKKKRAAS